MAEILQNPMSLITSHLPGDREFEAEKKRQKNGQKNTTEAGMSLKTQVEKMSASRHFLPLQDVYEKKGTYMSLSKMLMKRKAVKRFGVMRNLALNYLTCANKAVRRDAPKKLTDSFSSSELGWISSSIPRFSMQGEARSDVTGTNRPLEPRSPFLTLCAAADKMSLRGCQPRTF